MKSAGNRVSAKEPSPGKSLFKDISRILIVVAIFLIAAFLFQSSLIRDHLFDIQTIRADLNPADGRLRSFLIFLFLGGALVGFGLPRMWLSFVAGAIYGSLLGTGLALVATMGGAMITYIQGRSLMGSLLRRRLGKRFEKWTRRFQRNAVMAMISLRLLPLTNATLTSLIAGACRVPVGAYLLGNLIGFIPLTVVAALTGSGAAKANNYQLIIGIVGFVIVALIQWMWTRRSSHTE